MTVSTEEGLKVFYSYSHKDEQYRDQLEEHLSMLKRQGFISEWHDRKINAGCDWEKEIDAHIEDAEIILLLISSSFLASDYCTAKELTKALDNHETGKSRVIPIFIRPVDWSGASFSKLQGFPKDGLPVTSWPNQDNAWLDVARGIRKTVEEIRKNKQRVGEVKKLLSMPELLTQEVVRIDRLFQSEDKSYSGLPTGYVSIDDRTDGLHPGDLFVISGRQSIDKTDLALNIAQNVAIKAGIPVAVFSMRISAIEAARRMMASTARLNYYQQVRGQLEDTDWEKLTYALGKLNNASLFFDDSPTLSIRELTIRCREMIRDTGHIGLIVIDSLQHIAVADQSHSNYSAISRAIKTLARELEVPIVVTSQVSRNVELRPNKRPILADLGDWSSLEDDADVIVFLYRDEVYNPDSLDRGITELLIQKNQRGAVVKTNLTYFPENARFEDLGLSGSDIRSTGDDDNDR